MRSRTKERVSLALATCLLAGCTTVGTYVPPQPVLVDVQRDGDRFQATYTMPSDSPIWAMRRSGEVSETGEPWRPGMWRVTTPGVELQRIGNHDALVALKGNVPRNVTVELDIADVDVRFGYEPAIVMSNGSLALFSGQFATFPMRDAGSLQVLDGYYEQAIEMRFSDAGREVIQNGAPTGTAVFKHDGYVVYGPVSLTNTDSGDAVIDPGMPDWLAEEVSSFTGLALEHYAQRIGMPLRGRPQLVAAWDGPVPGITRTSGSAIETTLIMRFAGSGFTERNYPALVYAQQLIAHEAAHIWLGEMVATTGRSNRWITEGGASLLAVRMQQALDAELNRDDAEVFETTQRLAELIEGRQPYAVRDYLQQAQTECGTWLEGGSVGTAHERNQDRAFYDCGAVFAMAVEMAGADRGEDFFDFVALLIERNPDGLVDLGEWLAAAMDFGLPEEKAALVEQLVTEGTGDGKSAIAILLAE